MRILFMGTPDFAVPSLKRLSEDGHTVCGVFTQPDKRKNRGHKLIFSPVKEYALSQNIPVHQPVTLKDGEALELVRTLLPDLIVAAAYGKIIPAEFLSIPKYGAINVHSSLLPKYRGAAPIHRAIMDGEAETGVTIMYMAPELDAGDIILQKRVRIKPDEDSEALSVRLSELGAEALSEAVTALSDGTAPRIPQDHRKATYAHMLSRELSPVDWTRSAHAIHCQIRGLLPWPCATTDRIDGNTEQPLKLYRAVETGESTSVCPGVIVSAGKDGIEIACGDGKILRITELQASGGKRMSAAAYLLGHPVKN